MMTNKGLVSGVTTIKKKRNKRTTTTKEEEEEEEEQQQPGSPSESSHINTKTEIKPSSICERVAADLMKTCELNQVEFDKENVLPVKFKGFGVNKTVLQKYLSGRIEKSPILIFAVILLERIFMNNKELVLTKHNVIPLMAISLIEWDKYSNDESYSNKYYAKLFDITLKSINLIEARFLQLIDYDFSIEPSVYKKKLAYYEEAAVTAALYRKRVNTRYCYCYFVLRQK